MTTPRESPAANQAALPYPPDKRPELSIMKGEKFKLLHVNDDGYCLVLPVRETPNMFP